MILCNLLWGGRGTYHNLRNLTAHRICIRSMLDVQAANDRVYHRVTVLPVPSPRREP